MKLVFYSLLLLYFTLITILLPGVIGSDPPIGQLCTRAQNSTTNKSNIARVLAELSAKAPATNFATSVVGEGKEKAYGLAQCRGDVSATDCKQCLADASNYFKQSCADGDDARVWYDYCFVRYGVEDFIGRLDTGYGIFLYNVENASDGDNFSKSVGELMGRVRKQALVPKSRGLGKEKVQFSPFITLYGLVQCNGDLSQLECAQCLSIAIARYPSFCPYAVGCQVLYSSCKIRYEIYPFYFPVDQGAKQIRSAGSYGKSIVYPN